MIKLIYWQIFHILSITGIELWSRPSSSQGFYEYTSRDKPIDYLFPVSMAFSKEIIPVLKVNIRVQLSTASISSIAGHIGLWIRNDSVSLQAKFLQHNQQVKIVYNLHFRPSINSYNEDLKDLSFQFKSQLRFTPILSIATRCLDDIYCWTTENSCFAQSDNLTNVFDCVTRRSGLKDRWPKSWHTHTPANCYN